jgi:hypothetical protein
MKIMSASVAPHNGAGREKCLVTLHVALAGRQQSMTIVVVVPDEKDESATRECGARPPHIACPIVRTAPITKITSVHPIRKFGDHLACDASAAAACAVACPYWLCGGGEKGNEQIVRIGRFHENSVRFGRFLLAPGWSITQRGPILRQRFRPTPVMRARTRSSSVSLPPFAHIVNRMRP